MKARIKEIQKKVYIKCKSLGYEQRSLDGTAVLEKTLSAGRNFKAAYEKDLAYGVIRSTIPHDLLSVVG